MTRISKKAGTASPSFQGQYAQPLVLYLEFHLPARERKAVNPFRIILILGTGIQGQRIFQRTPLFRRHGTAKRFGNFHIQPFIGDSRKPFRRLRNAVRQRNIGLDIQNGGAITKSTPERCNTGPSRGCNSTRSSLTADNPMGLGRNGARVANTPMRTLPPSRGGRTVGLPPVSPFSLTAPPSHRWENPSRPRTASG